MRLFTYNRKPSLLQIYKVHMPFSNGNLATKMKKYVKIQGHNMQKDVKINIPGFSTQNSKAKTYQKNDLLPPLLRDPLRDGLVRFTEGLLHQRPSVK